MILLAGLLDLNKVPEESGKRNRFGRWIGKVLRKECNDLRKGLEDFGLGLGLGLGWIRIRMK